MLTVEQALDAILTCVVSRPPVPVPLIEAHGRVLAEDVFADIDSPPFDNTAVDGYAVRAEDTHSASPENPILLHELDDVPAGVVSPVVVTQGGCVRLMTGAPIPKGADAMVMIEDTRRRAEGVVEVSAPAYPGDHLRRAGEDVRQGMRVLKAGTVIHAAEIAMLAAMGQARPLCYPPPRVAVFATGDELVDVGEKPGPGQIRNSNGYALAALVAEAGAELHSIRHLPDNEETIEAAFHSCTVPDDPKAADVIVTSGGVSVGDRDFIKPILERIGRLELWRVRMKPGKPLAFGRIGKTLFFGLPGNPVSTMVTFELFVRPTLRKMAGHSNVDRPQVSAQLSTNLQHTPGRREYVRAVITLQDNTYHAMPTGAQASGILSSMLGANALLVIPEQANELLAGETIIALLLDAPGSRQDLTREGE